MTHHIELTFGQDLPHLVDDNLKFTVQFLVVIVGNQVFKGRTVTNDEFMDTTKGREFFRVVYSEYLSSPTYEVSLLHEMEHGHDHSDWCETYLQTVNPVVRVGREPTTFLRIKLIDELHQSDDTLLEHVLIRELFVLIIHFLSEFTHQTKL